MVKPTEKSVYILTARDKNGWDDPIYVAYDRETIEKARNEWSEAKKDSDYWLKRQSGEVHTNIYTVPVVEPE